MDFLSKLLGKSPGKDVPIGPSGRFEVGCCVQDSVFVFRRDVFYFSIINVFFEYSNNSRLMCVCVDFDRFNLESGFVSDSVIVF